MFCVCVFGQTVGCVSGLKLKHQVEELTPFEQKGERLTDGQRERGNEEKPCPSVEQWIDRFTVCVHICCVAAVRAV